MGAWHGRAMSNLLAPEDLFTTGIGCDISGAYLVARGLLMRPADIRAITSTRLEYSGPQIASRVHDRVAGRFGVGALIVGFIFQLAGFIVVTGTDLDARPSWGRGVAALAFAAVGGGAVMAVYFCGRARVFRLETIEVAQFDGYGERQPLPDGGLLRDVSKDRWPQHDGETLSEYALRVWRLDEIDEPPD